MALRYDCCICHRQFLGLYCSAVCSHETLCGNCLRKYHLYGRGLPLYCAQCGEPFCAIKADDDDDDDDEQRCDEAAD